MFNLNKTEIWQGKTLGQYFGLASLDEKIFQVLESEKSCNDSEFDRADGNSNRSYLADISLAHSSSGFKPPMGALSTKRGSITPSVC
jgi:hypothetical protein